REPALGRQLLHEGDDVEPEPGGQERRATPGEQLDVPDVHAANRILARSGYRANRASRAEGARTPRGPGYSLSFRFAMRRPSRAIWLRGERSTSGRAALPV